MIHACAETKEFAKKGASGRERYNGKNKNRVREAQDKLAAK